jgi:hypothetical protein
MSLSNASRIKASNPPKRRKFRLSLGYLTFLLGLPLLFYFGYCWGLWGRNSLLLQYLFQCNCPPISEEARFSKQVDVVVSACGNGGVSLSPGGQLLYVRGRNNRPGSTYLLDLQTQEKIQFALPEGSNYFLTDNLIFLSLDYGGGEYIYDNSTEKQYPIQSFIQVQPNAYSYGKLDSGLLFRALLQVEEVFLIDAPYQPVVALSSDFRTRPEHSFTFQASALSGENTDWLEQFLRQNNIKYFHIMATLPHEVVSPDGHYVARDDGIYLLETNQLIVKAPLSFVRGWTSDSRGALYSSGGLCLLPRGLPFADDTGCAIRVPQPVLLLKVPISP